MRKYHLRAYLRVWLKLTAQLFQSQIANSRGAALLFIMGKLLRLATACLLVYVVVGRAKLISGYSLNQAIFILLLFNLIQTFSQLFLRGVYMFRQKVIDGTFDFYLLNPLSELFYSLFSYTDPLDIVVFIPYLFLTGWGLVNAGYALTVWSALIILLITILTFIMVISWHILIISIGVRYLEVDNTIMLYRDIERMGAFPVDIYGKLGQFLLTYLAPFALMATIPAKYIFGQYNPLLLIVIALIAYLELRLSIWFWQRCLIHYSSSSS